MGHRSCRSRRTRCGERAVCRDQCRRLLRLRCLCPRGGISDQGSKQSGCDGDGGLSAGKHAFGLRHGQPRHLQARCKRRTCRGRRVCEHRPRRRWPCPRRRAQRRTPRHPDRLASLDEFLGLQSGVLRTTRRGFCEIPPRVRHAAEIRVLHPHGRRSIDPRGQGPLRRAANHRLMVWRDLSRRQSLRGRVDPKGDRRR